MRNVSKPTMRKPIETWTNSISAQRGVQNHYKVHKYKLKVRQDFNPSDWQKVKSLIM